jgi:hypothetical protein
MKKRDQQRRDAGVERPPAKAELPPVLEDSRELEETWADEPGFWGWLCSVDHKAIGRRYLGTAMVMFLLAGGLAALMRLQLSRPENPLMGPDLYNQVTEYHLGSGAMLERLAIVRHLFGRQSDMIIARWDQIDVRRPDALALTCPVEELTHEKR